MSEALRIRSLRALVFRCPVDTAVGWAALEERPGLGANADLKALREFAIRT